MASADGPDLELQAAIVKRLKADPAVNALVAGRVYDAVPTNAVFPYVSYGPCNALLDDADCIGGFDIAVQLDIWSRGVGFPEAKRVVEAVRVSLHDQEDAIPLPVHALVFLECLSSNVVRDPDGLTSHGILSVQAIIERRPPPTYP